MDRRSGGDVRWTLVSTSAQPGRLYDNLPQRRQYAQQPLGADGLPFCSAPGQAAAQVERYVRYGVF